VNTFLKIWLAVTIPTFAYFHKAYELPWIVEVAVASVVLLGVGLMVGGFSKLAWMKVTGRLPHSPSPSQHP
jgi:uncharacterized membrane protein